MGRLVPTLAGPADDASLRELLAANPVPGTITVSYRTDPSYFAATALLGPFAQTVIGRDEGDGQLGALACRSVRDRYVGGALRPVGYLSGLRVDERQQGRWIVSRGLRYMRDLDADGRTSGYLATIVAGSVHAKSVLVDRPRVGFPSFVPLRELLTMALPTGTLRHERDAGRVTVRAAARSELWAIAAFLAENGSRRCFFPAFGTDDLAGETPQGAGISDGDVLMAVSDGQILGAVVLWDQTSLKQAVVCSYSPGVDRFRPALDVVARIAGATGLPAPGGSLITAYAALLSVAEDDVAVARALLTEAARLARERGVGFLMVGMTGDDPLVAALAWRPRITYRSTVYAVGWGGTAERLAAECAGRPLHVEIATL